MSIGATAALVLVSTGPASAEPGSGVTTGYTSVNISNHNIGAPLCLQVTSLTITLNNVGSFSSAGGGVYVGNTTATFTMNTGASYWFNPAGTFTDSNCTQPALVPGTLTVTSNGTPTQGSTVSCSGTAVYNRTGENAEVTTALKSSTAVGTNTCTVNGAAALSSVITFTGSQQPCLSDFPLPLPDPCTAVQGVDSEWVGTYTVA